MWTQHRYRIIVTCHFHSKNMRVLKMKTLHGGGGNEHVRLEECEEGKILFGEATVI